MTSPHTARSTMPRPDHGLSCARVPHGGRKQLQGLLPPAFLVLAGESPEPFPGRRLDDFTGIEHSAIAASIAPTARPYLKPDDAPCFGIACARSISARIGLCRSMKLRMAATSTRSLAPVPTTGMSMHSTNTGAAPSVISTTANPPLMPGSTPRTLMARLPHACWLGGRARRRRRRAGRR